MSLERLSASLADRYTIERELGAGGMATVYLAHDIKHDRQVAVKVVKPELGAVLGAERFLSEIKVTANLHHPNLLPLFDSGAADGLLYYVMPYVEGETLRARLDREQQLPVDETIRLTTLLAAALDYAHARNVIHRDLKPENILLQAGQPMIADFGIALAVAHAGGTRVTATGLSLGTPYYMSPEQATGDRVIDARSDQYALGAVTYEMLTGEPPHTGANAQAIIARVLTETPRSVRSTRPAVTPAMDLAIHRALARPPADRFASCGDFSRALGLGATAAMTSVPDAAARRRWWLVGAAVLAVVAVVAFWPRSRGIAITIGKSTQVTNDPGLEYDAAISPDGKFVAYAVDASGGQRIVVRQVGGGSPVMIARDAPRVQILPLWSPDGQRLIFASERGIEIIPALGGPSRLLVAARPRNGHIFPGPWSPNGREFAYALGDSIFVRPVEGAGGRAVAGVHDPHSLAWSPDGRWLAYVSGNSVARSPGSTYGNVASSVIGVVRAEGGTPIQVTSGTDIDGSPAWLGDGRTLLFVSNRDGPRDVYAVALDGNGHPHSLPVRLTTGLGASFISLARDGRTLAYTVFTEHSNVWSLPIPSGAPVSISQATPVTRGNQVIESFDISPDGRWLAFDGDRGGTYNLWRMPLGGGEPEPLTSGPTSKFGPNWSPDGREIAYHAFDAGKRDLYVIPGTGGTPVRITHGPADNYISPEWSADGRRLTANANTADTGYSVVVERDADGHWGSPRRRFGSRSVSSPDGRLWAVWTEAGLFIYSGAGDSLRTLLRGNVPTSGGEWSADSRMLYFLSPDSSGNIVAISAAPPAGGPIRTLVRFDDPTRPYHRFGLRVHGDRVYFTLGERESDVWVADVKTP